MTDLEAICRTIAWFKHRSSRRIEEIKAQHTGMSAEDIRIAERQAIDEIWPLYTDLAREIVACIEERKRGAAGVPVEPRPAVDPEMNEVAELMMGFIGPRHYLAVVLMPHGEIRRVTSMCDHHEGQVLRAIIEDLDEAAPHGDWCNSRRLN
jgi:hypothetical protein